MVCCCFEERLSPDLMFGNSPSSLLRLWVFAPFWNANLQFLEFAEFYLAGFR
jgi:hypothetical protein